MSPDPILSPSNPQQNNGYAYSANDAISDSDQTGSCYQTSSDSLNFRTNCIGSVGSTAGNGAAYVAHSAPQIAGNSSSDYSAYRLITGPATTVAGLNFKIQQAQVLLQAELDIAIQKLAPQVSSYLAMRQGLEANMTSTGLGLAGIGGVFSAEENADPESEALATTDEEELGFQTQNEGLGAASTLRLGGTTGMVAVAAKVPVSKFSDYIFKEGASHGKDAVFRSYGYGSDDSQSLASLYEQQAATKFAAGDYTLGRSDQYGQRINITLRGQGAAAGRSTELVSGWMIRGDGSITLNTPFSGFAK